MEQIVLIDTVNWKSLPLVPVSSNVRFKKIPHGQVRDFYYFFSMKMILPFMRKVQISHFSKPFPERIMDTRSHSGLMIISAVSKTHRSLNSIFEGVTLRR